MGQNRKEYTPTHLQAIAAEVLKTHPGAALERVEAVDPDGQIYRIRLIHVADTYDLAGFNHGGRLILEIEPLEGEQVVARSKTADAVTQPIDQHGKLGLATRRRPR